ncbi:MAG TPA: hypothetical protein VH881_03110 [Burkholderiales bacterium]|jgi:hypothetical protein
MSDSSEQAVAKADPAARRRAVLAIIFGATVGGLLIAGFDHFGEPFRAWLTSDPAATAGRARLAIYLSALVLSAPVIAFAVYLWLLGKRVLRAQQFPPPGFRVIRDTPVMDGPTAVVRGQVIQTLALCLGLAAALLWLFFWWLARTIGPGAAG